MDKVILEKLLHTYKIFEGNDLEKSERIFGKNWQLANHFKKQDFEKNTTREYFLDCSKWIQQSQKFSVDVRDNTLTAEEISKISDEIIFCLPYENVFLQYCTDDGGVINLCVRELETDDEDMSQFEIIMMPYVPQWNCFIFDPNTYEFVFKKDQTYQFTIDEEKSISRWGDVTSFTTHNGTYNNQSMIRWARTMANCVAQFMLMLTFPQITQSNQVKGIKPQTLQSLSRFKTSELRTKPTSEHKTLKIDLYGNESCGSGQSNGRSEGTKFHSVRKHLRKLRDGKHTFVKAHFRGNKEFGVIQKDYEVRS